MELIGMLDSPFVRRVAVTARFLDIPYEHNPLSIFKSYDEFRGVNPLVKVPTLVTDVTDDGVMLVDSTLIIDYLYSLCAKGTRLMPEDGPDRIRALQIIGVALVAMEKIASLIYERTQRPRELQHAPWIKRLDQQLRAAVEQLESDVGDGLAWFFGADMTQADITTAIAWRFTQYAVPKRIAAADYPGLVAFSARAEALPEFIACPLN
jgi:glutathione S-transferase